MQVYAAMSCELGVRRVVAVFRSEARAKQFVTEHQPQQTRVEALDFAPTSGRVFAAHRWAEGVSFFFVGLFDDLASARRTAGPGGWVIALDLD